MACCRFYHRGAPIVLPTKPSDISSSGAMNADVPGALLFDLGSSSADTSYMMD